MDPEDFPFDPYGTYNEFMRSGRLEQIADEKANKFVDKHTNGLDINVDKLGKYLSGEKHCKERVDNIQKRCTLVNKINGILRETFDGRSINGNIGHQGLISSLEYIHLNSSDTPDRVYFGGKNANFKSESIGQFGRADGSYLWLDDKYQKEAQKYFDSYLSNFSLKPTIKFITKIKEELPTNWVNHVVWTDYRWQDNKSLTEEFAQTKNRDKFPDKLKDLKILGSVKEHAYENGEYFDHLNLIAGFMPKEIYQQTHAGMAFPCHDIMIEYNGGLLLVVRDNYPAKNVLWPIGGRLERGLSVIDSLRRKVKAECGLDLEGDLHFLGWERTYFKTDPFGHGHGTDTVNARYFAKGKGEIKLDKLHEKPTIVKPLDYNIQFRASLDPYVRDFMDESMQLLSAGKVRRDFLESFYEAA
jgi:colanic acid biosynthesis protein WcaH